MEPEAEDLESPEAECSSLSTPTAPLQQWWLISGRDVLLLAAGGLISIVGAYLLQVWVFGPSSSEFHSELASSSDELTIAGRDLDSVTYWMDECRDALSSVDAVVAAVNFGGGPTFSDDELSTLQQDLPVWRDELRLLYAWRNQAQSRFRASDAKAASLLLDGIRGQLPFVCTRASLADAADDEP